MWGELVVDLWSDQMLLTALDLVDNQGYSASEVASILSMRFHIHVSRSAVIGAIYRVREADAKVLDCCSRPENRNGGMPKRWWQRPASGVAA